MNMGITCATITTDEHHNTRIGVISDSSLMFLTGREGSIDFITKDLKIICDNGKSIYHLDDMGAISRRLGSNYAVNIPQLYPNYDFNFERYTLFTIKCQHSYALSRYYNFVMITPDQRSMKKHDKYYATLRKYKFIHNILLPDVTNMIFQLIMSMEIDQYYLTELNKITMPFIIDKEFKHKFINAIHDKI